MGYTRRRAVLSEIERYCAIALLAYHDCAGALKAGDAKHFQRSLALLRDAAERLDQLLRPVDTAEWLGVAEGSPLHRCADADALPDLMSAVAELRHRAEQEMEYLRQVV
jgi:hypothetical protein